MNSYPSKVTDGAIMSFGKCKGVKMANIPANYLLWLYENNKCTEPVREYIKENLNDLKNERSK